MLVFRLVESLAGRCAPGSDFVPVRLKFKSNYTCRLVGARQYLTLLQWCSSVEAYKHMPAIPARSRTFVYPPSRSLSPAERERDSI